MCTYYQSRYSRTNMSAKPGNVGHILGLHSDKLNTLRTNKDIEDFINSILPDICDEGKRYITTEFINSLNERTFARNYQFLYNIYLAGFSDLKMGNVGHGKF